jgi:mannose-6-phosphate isomerase
VIDVLAQHLLVLQPQYRERVWGGQRLRPSQPPIGESWIAHGPSVVAAGEYSGKNLDELMAMYGPDLMGTMVQERYPDRFPLLIKLLDCAEWLSVQVHPNDEQARRLVGPTAYGKTEAWYFLDAGRGGQILVGVKPGVDRDGLAAAIKAGHVLEVVEHVDVQTGNALLIPAGTLHALGPGLLLYEIQQASDTTYRAYDWGRPQSAGRTLHIEEAIEVAEALGPAAKGHPQIDGTSGQTPAIACDLFAVDLIRTLPSTPAVADTAGRAFHVVTATSGTIQISAHGECISLGRYETALIAGSTGPYEIVALDGPAEYLRAMVPD